MRSLTRAEAARRAALVSVTSYSIDLDFTGDTATFASVTTIRFTVADPDEPCFLEIVPARLRAVHLNGVPVDTDTAFAAAGGRLTLTGLAADNELVVDAVMAYSRDGEGVHRHVDPADGKVYLYANSSVTAGPRWFACFDQPDLKATVRLSITCPPGWRVAGNGAATEVGPGRWELAETKPFSTYLVAFVAGPYHSVTGSHDGIPLGLHARQSLARDLDRDAEELLTLTAECFDEFHRLFDIRYPWGEYHQAFVPEFNWGAMENPGCVTIRDPLLFRARVTDGERAHRGSVVAHEMAHMWFGNLVTMRWWDDLWLNESFAEYLGHRVYSTVTGHDLWVDFGATRKSWGYAADRRPTTHPVAGNGVADAESALNDFDGISYAKGATVLRQLATHLGDKIFFGGVRRYFAEHSYGNAEFADLIGAWGSAGATGLPGWAQQWLRTSGMDTLRVETGAARVIRTSAGDAGRAHSINVASYDASGAELTRAAIQLTAPDAAIPPPPPRTALVLPDADDATWAKIALTAAEWRVMPSLLANLDAPARVVVWNALRLAVEDAELAPALALDIAVASLAAEQDEAVLSASARWATDTLLAAYLSGDAARAAGGRRLQQALHAALSGSVRGSGFELAAVRAWLEVCDAESLLEGLRSGQCAGVELDVELRWRVLQRLAALGHLSGDQLDAATADDRSTQGAVQAAKCRAMLPDPDAKAREWETLMQDAHCSNYELYATAAGFWHPLHRELTGPYVARYFAEIAGTATLRSGWVVGLLARYAFPRTAIDAGTLAMGTDLLAVPGLHEGIRRAVTDGADDLRRAVASHAAFPPD